MALIGGAVLLLLTEWMAPFLPGWLNADPEIRREGYLYYAIVCVPMMFRARAVFAAPPARRARPSGRRGSR